MPLPELLDELFRLYRRHFSLIIGVALLVALPGLVWSLATGIYKLNSASYASLFTTTPGAAPSFNSQQLSTLVGAIALGVIGGILFLPVSVGAVYRAVTEVALGRPATIPSVLRETLARYLKLLGLFAIAALLVLGWFIAEIIGAVLLVLPAIAVFCAAVYFYVRWSLSVAAMMAEEIGPIRGMGRSWNLVKGQWWRTVGILLIVGILQGIISYGLGILFTLIAALVTSGDLQAAVVQILGTLVSAVVSPITTIAVVLLYFDLRVRKEGLDLDQLAQQTSPGPVPA
ncbi:MAG: glycerophosphoryl diester phosphodiesterase membrane domain-containing protein [Candidatus Dormibacteraeota bacterium]|nr:glycerophosphoryl diester phosphodiesterase membrane domain-containing protein [Candidatus Dormibacteraeota bacterium]